LCYRLASSLGDQHHRLAAPGDLILIPAFRATVSMSEPGHSSGHPGRPEACLPAGNFRHPAPDAVLVSPRLHSATEATE
jgi:hypothetical protein